MKKFFVLFRIPVANIDEWVNSTSPEERRRQMNDIMKGWGTWREKHKGAIFDLGSPLGKTKTVTSAGITETRNDLNYYMVVQAKSHEAAIELFSDNPHMMIPASQIDVLDIIERNGMWDGATGLNFARRNILC